MVTLLVKESKNIREKITGLIGKEKAFALLIKTHFGIHTFGLKFPIDVLILDRYNKVIVIRKSLKPNRIFVWNPIYERVLELPEGIIDQRKIKINDTVNLKPNTLY